MTETDKEKYMWILLTEAYGFQEFQIEGVFETHGEAEEYVHEELNSSMSYDIRKGRYY